MAQLLDAVGAGSFDPHYNGSDAVVIKLWDGREVVGNYHRCEESELDTRTQDDLFFDVEPLRPLINKLLVDGTAFVTETGESEDMCTLKWTVRTPAK